MKLKMTLSEFRKLEVCASAPIRSVNTGVMEPAGATMQSAAIFLAISSSGRKKMINQHAAADAKRDTEDQDEDNIMQLFGIAFDVKHEAQHEHGNKTICHGKRLGDGADNLGKANMQKH